MKSTSGFELANRLIAMVEQSSKINGTDAISYPYVAGFLSVVVRDLSCLPGAKKRLESVVESLASISSGNNV